MTNGIVFVVGVHPDELHNPHYAFDIVDDIEKIAEQVKKGDNND